VRALVAALAWLLLMIALPRAAAALEVVPVDGPPQRLAARAEVLEDPAQALGIDDVRGPAALRFVPLDPDKTNRGFSASAFWLRFRMRSERGGSFVVELSATPQVAELHDDAGGPPRRSGVSLPFGERDVRSSNVALRFQLAPGEERTYYLRLKANDTLVLDPKIW
jgi:hypothetical protein